MRAWEIISDRGIDGLQLSEREKSVPGPGEVLVEMKASSINYRDLATIEDPVSRHLPYPTIPNSDGAGTISTVGPGVTEFAKGDRVTSCFFSDWQAGPITERAMASALGGARPGVLAEEVILPVGGVISAPEHLTDAEAATLPCAALTAWHALTEPVPVLPGDTVLLLGTGGVSVFAQQFCSLMGVRTIVTSSSDEKLSKMAELGAWTGLNYRTTPEWDTAAIDLTEGIGVDRVVEVGGPGTLQKSINATRVGGTIALIGVLTGASGAVQATPIMRKSITLKGVYVGSRAMFDRMNKAITAHGLRPVIDQHFAFENAPQAYHIMRAAQHVGKLVIEL